MRKDEFKALVQSLQFMAGPGSGMRLYKSKTPFFNVIKPLNNDDPQHTRYFSIMMDAMLQNYQDGTFLDDGANLRHTVVLVQVRRHKGNFGNPRFFNVDEAGVREFVPDEKMADKHVSEDMREFSPVFKQVKFIPIQKAERVDGELVELKSKVDDAIKQAQVAVALDKVYPEIKKPELAEEPKARPGEDVRMEVIKSIGESASQKVVEKERAKSMDVVAGEVEVGRPTLGVIENKEKKKE